jgi:hypothetical protein
VADKHAAKGKKGDRDGFFWSWASLFSGLTDHCICQSL